MTEAPQRDLSASIIVELYERREQLVIETLAAVVVDGWDLETLIDYAVDGIVESYQKYGFYLWKKDLEDNLEAVNTMLNNPTPPVSLEEDCAILDGIVVDD